MRLSRGESVAASRAARPSAAPRPGPRGRLGGAAFGAWRADLGTARGGARAPRALPGLGWLRRREGDSGSEGEGETSERARRRAELLFGAEVAEELARRRASVDGPLDPRRDPDSGLAARWRRLRRNARREGRGEEDGGAKGERGEGVGAVAEGRTDGRGTKGGSRSESEDLEAGDSDFDSSDSESSSYSNAQRSVDALFDPLAAGPAPPPLADVAAVADVEPEDLWWLRRSRYALKARHIREQLPQYDALFRQEEEDQRRDEALRAEIAEAVREEERAERAREAEQAQRETAARKRGGRADKGARPWTIPELWPRGKTPTERDLHEGIDALLRSRVREALEGRAAEDGWEDAQLIRALAGLPPMRKMPEIGEVSGGGTAGNGAGGENATESRIGGGSGAAERGLSGSGAPARGKGSGKGSGDAARNDSSTRATSSASTPLASGSTDPSTSARRQAGEDAPRLASASASAAPSAWAVAPSSAASAASPPPVLSVPPPLPFPSGGARRLWHPKRGVSPKDPNAEVPERYSESDSDEEWERREAPRYAERPDVEVTMDFVESIGARLVGVPSTALADPGGRSVTALLEAESAARWRFRLSKATPENAMRLLAAEGREVARDADRLRRDAADLAKRVAKVREGWGKGGKGAAEGSGGVEATTKGARCANGSDEAAGNDDGGAAAGNAAGDAASNASSLSPRLPSALEIPALAPILFPNGEEDYVDPDEPQPPREAFLAALRFLRTRPECEAAAGGLLRRGDAVVMRAARAHWLYLTFNPRTASDAVNRLLVTAHFTGARVSGPVFMPTRRQSYSFLRSPHVNKTSQEQYEARWHTRLVDVLDPTPATYAAISRLNMPGGMSSTVMFQAEIDALRARGAKAKARRRRLREGRPTAEDDAITRRVQAERLARRKQAIQDELERMALAKMGDAGDKAWDARIKRMADQYRQPELSDDDLYRRLQVGRAQIYRTLDRVSESGGRDAKRLAKAYEAAVAIAGRREDARNR